MVAKEYDNPKAPGKKAELPVGWDKTKINTGAFETQPVIINGREVLVITYPDGSKEAGVLPPKGELKKILNLYNFNYETLKMNEK